MAAEAPPLAADELARLSVAQFGARLLLEQLARIARHETGTRSGDDPEDLHKMRVATRRLRVAFATFGDALRTAGVGELPVAETKRVADALGEVRDLDVFMAWLDARASEWGPGSDEAAAVERLRRERRGRWEDARSRLLAALDGRDMAALRGDLRGRLEAIGYPPFHVPGAGVKKKERAGRAGRRLAEKARRRLQKRGKGMFAPTAEELHRVRIAAKRFRYVCEFVRPAMEERGAQLDEAISSATAIQDSLGDLHDAEVAETALLDDVVRLGYEGQARDAGTIAGLVKAQRKRREAALLRFREQWERRPKDGWLKERSAAETSDTSTAEEAKRNGDD